MNITDYNIILSIDNAIIFLGSLLAFIVLYQFVKNRSLKYITIGYSALLLYSIANIVLKTSIHTLDIIVFLTGFIYLIGIGIITTNIESLNIIYVENPVETRKNFFRFILYFSFTLYIIIGIIIVIVANEKNSTTLLKYIYYLIGAILWFKIISQSPISLLLAVGLFLSTVLTMFFSLFKSPIYIYSVLFLNIVSLSGLTLYIITETLKDINNRNSNKIDLMNKKIHAIQTLTQELNKVDNIDDVLNIILENIISTLKAEAGAIYLYNKSSDSLTCKAVTGIFSPNSTFKNVGLINKKHIHNYIKSEIISIGEGLIGKIAKNKKPILIKNAENNNEFFQTLADITAVKTAMYSPLKVSEKFLGIIGLNNKENHNQFNDDDFEIFNTLTNQAAIAIENNMLVKEILNNEIVQQDLKIAQTIQLALLPKKIPKTEHIEFGANYLSAKEVGGDYYDIIKLDDSRYAMIVADVSGKGIAGSLIMTIVRTIFHTRAKDTASPADLLRIANKIIKKDIPLGMFVSALFSIIDIEKKNIIFSSAGHNPPLYYSYQSNNINEEELPGMALGLDGGEKFDSVISNKEISFNKNDIFIIYTDGVNEAMNKDDKLYGMDRFIKVTKGFHQDSMPKIIENVMKDIKIFTGDIPQNDDITLVGCKLV